MAKIDHAHLLTALSDELLIPKAVKEEVSLGAEGDPARQWLRKEGSRHVRTTGAVATKVASWDLGHGETAVLSWAYAHPGWEVIVDDRAARNCAESLEVLYRGTIGVMLLAKREGHIEHAKPLLQSAVEAGLRVSPDLFEAALQLVGEG